jgi:tetratricopeptide (TPR) repeat protein
MPEMADKKKPDSRGLDDRTVLPRWRRPVESTRVLAGTAKAAPRRTLDALKSRWMPRVEQDFFSHRSPNVAQELVETAFMVNAVDEASVHAATDILTRSGKASQIVSLGNTTPAILSHEKHIADLKRIVREYPGQPLRWTELARHYLCLAEDDKAIRAMTVALSLAPTNVLIVRSAVRMFVHLEQYDDATRALKLSRRVTSNPWLLAAEVATHSHQRKTSRYMKQAMALLDDRSIQPMHSAELAAAVGTVEHDNGRHKRAKLLFGQALLDPTENALAQALFVSQADNHIKIPDRALASTPDSYEANARAAHSAGDWQGMQEEASRWLTDEPFDIRPALLGSFVSFAPGCEAAAVAIATDGLRANPHDALLINNRAVAAAFNGDLATAWLDLVQAKKLGHAHAYLTATVGLSAFRTGFPQYGAVAYQQAVRHYVEARDAESAVRAQLYWLREEIRQGTLGCDRVLEVTRKKASKLGLGRREPEIDALVALAESELAARRPTPATASGSETDMAALFSHYEIATPTSADAPVLGTELMDKL